MHQRILILDYGSQVSQLIARRVREAGVYCELHAGDVSEDFLQSQVARASRASFFPAVMRRHMTTPR